MIALLASKRRRLAAQAAWPGCGRIAWMRASKGRCELFVASTVMAPATSAMRASRQVRVKASTRMAVLICVPLISDNPSFARSL